MRGGCDGVLPEGYRLVDSDSQRALHVVDFFEKQE